MIAVCLSAQFWELVGYMVYANLRAEAARTYANFLWWVLDPLLYMAVMYLVFGGVLGRGGQDYILVLMTGLVPWMWYRNGISNASRSILGNRALMNQVKLPKFLFPVVTLLTDSAKFLVVLVLLLTLLLVIAGWPPVTWLGLPLVLAVHFVLIAGAACLMAAIVPLVPDLRFLVDSLLHLQFFGSGIFFTLADVPERYTGLFLINPMACVLVDYRRVLLEGQWPHPGTLGWTLAVGVALLATALWILARFDKRYPRLLP